MIRHSDVLYAVRRNSRVVAPRSTALAIRLVCSRTDWQTAALGVPFCGPEAAIQRRRRVPSRWPDDRARQHRPHQITSRTRKIPAMSALRDPTSCSLPVTNWWRQASVCRTPTSTFNRRVRGLPRSRSISATSFRCRPAGLRPADTSSTSLTGGRRARS